MKIVVPYHAGTIPGTKYTHAGIYEYLIKRESFCGFFTPNYGTVVPVSFTGPHITATRSFFAHHLRLISLAVVIGAALPVR